MFSIVPRSLLVFVFLAGLGSLTKAQADGMFVVPKFVWDKHKDINEPTQKAILVYDAGREDLILQVKYEGPVSEFGWLVPVPNLPTVQKGSMKCFYELSQYTQKHFETAGQHNQTKSGSYGVAGIDSEGKSEPPVKVIEIKTVGAYEIAVLAAKDTGALEKWLEANHFSFPTNATAVIDSYVQRQWYFVAAKVNLEQGVLGLISSALKLPAGELNPLQISFASGHCVYPLKISSANGTPSEIQVYVLSPEPLLEKTMLEKKLPLIYSNNLAQAARRAQSYKNMQALRMDMQSRIGGFALPPDSDEGKTVQMMSVTPEISPDDLLPYAKVSKTELPDSSKEISRLASKSWWLTKQTWNFKPEEMRDLEFAPAIPVFADKLGTKYGYYAAASLASYKADAVPALLAALQNTNPVVRVNAVSIFDQGYETINDPRLTQAALAWLKDSEPKVRLAAVDVLADYSNWNPKNAGPLVAMLRDEDVGVRHAVAFGLPRFRSDLEKYIPAIRAMLKDKDLNIRASAMNMLCRFGEPIAREDLRQFFSVPDRAVISMTLSQFRNKNENAGRKYDLSNEEVVPLLQNSEPLARMIGLGVLYQNANPQSVELALPLLKDPGKMLRARTAATLRALTRQHFTDEQAAEWEKWWNENKAQFVVQLHPEELRLQRRGIDDFRTLTNRPPVRVP